MLGLIVLGGAVYIGAKVGSKLVGGAADEAKKTFSSAAKEENSPRYNHHELTRDEKALIREYRIAKQLDERGMYEID